MALGLRVLRGPDWPSDDDRDGGEGHVGTVISMGGEGTCQVVWDNGTSKVCRIGAHGKHDLRILDNAPVGVRHPEAECDGCESKGVAGMLWKCSQCKKCNLCSFCYVTDKHDLSHAFVRYDTPTSEGVPVKRRSSSLKIRAMGLFPGATVLRGQDWNSGDIDGDSPGQLMSIVNNVSQASTRNMVKVRWSSGQLCEHRVGYQGKMDIKYKEESQGTYYYKEHLPYLDAKDTQHTTKRELEILQEGDKVCIQVSVSKLQAMQSQRSGWTSGMADCVGKIGVIKVFAPSGDATVEFGGLRFRFFPGALKKMPNLKVGDVVQVEADEEKLKNLLKGHVDWSEDIKQVQGKRGKVVKVGEDGNVVLGFGQKTVLMFAGCCTVTSGQVHNMEESSSNPRQSSDVEAGIHGDLLKLMAAVMMQERQQRSKADPEVLYQAIGRGDVSAVNTICKQNPSLANVSHKGVTPLILAAHEGQTEVVGALLDHGAKTTPTDLKGHTALHAALIGRKERTAKLLLQKGASAQPANNQKRTALHFAAFTNLHGIMPDLIRHGCPVNAKDVAGDTPLHDAIQKGNKEAVVVMLRAAKIDLAVPNERHFNPLQFSCFIGNAFATEAILKRDTSTVNLGKENDKFTALHIAAVNDHTDCARLLIDLGKANVDIQGPTSLTPLHVACNKAHLGFVELLLKKGANPNLKDSQGNTALHVAIGSQSIGIEGEHRLLAAMLGLSTRNDDEVRVKLACLLLQHDAVINATNNRGHTPLQVASSDTVRQAVRLYARQHDSSIKKTTEASSPRTDQIRIRMGPGGFFDLELPCIRCQEKKAEITVHPCEHKALCRDCCLVLNTCPLCDKPIERRTVKKKLCQPTCTKTKKDLYLTSLIQTGKDFQKWSAAF